MKNFNFRQMISNIFTLKSKTVTILLGTFVPFFLCHIIAQVCSSGDKYNYRFWVFLMAVVMFIVYLGWLIGLLWMVNNKSAYPLVEIIFVSLWVIFLLTFHSATAYSYHKTFVYSSPCLKEYK